MAQGRHILAGAATASAALCLALTLTGGLPASASAAAVSRPSASFSFEASSVAAGASPVLTYIVTDAPRGSGIYLERDSSGQPWQPVARMRASSGTVRAPGDPAGEYSYRIIVTEGGRLIAASAPEALAVTGGGCTACRVAKGVLPWLTPFVEPVIEYIVQQVGPTVLAWLAALVGL